MDECGSRRLDEGAESPSVATADPAIGDVKAMTAALPRLWPPFRSCRSENRRAETPGTRCENCGTAEEIPMLQDCGTAEKSPKIEKSPVRRPFLTARRKSRAELLVAVRRLLQIMKRTENSSAFVASDAQIGHARVR